MTGHYRHKAAIAIIKRDGRLPTLALEAARGRCTVQDRSVACPEVLLGLLLSAFAFALSPLLMPSSYSWVAHTLSQAASQGQPGSWLSRVGFLIAGLTVLRLSSCARLEWSQLTRNLHRVAGLAMLGAVAFTDRSWDPNTPFDPLENAVHSAIATTIYITFAFGVLANISRRFVTRRGIARFDIVTIGLMLFLPPIMLLAPEITGLVERVMFGVAYLWYGLAVARMSSPTGERNATLAWFRTRAAFGDVMQRRHPRVRRPSSS
jgi:hypothetical protein